MSLEGEKTSYALCFDFKTTNNKAKYEALITGLKLAEELEVNVIGVFLDSMLVVNQVTGTLQAKNERLTKYVHPTKCQIRQFKRVHLTQVARAENTKAGALARLASGIDRDEKMSVPVKKLLAPIIEQKEVAELTLTEPT